MSFIFQSISWALNSITILPEDAVVTPEAIEEAAPLPPIEVGLVCCSIWLELKLDKEARTGLWCWGEVVAEAEEAAGGADPKGGGTTKLDEEFILKVRSQVAEL